MVQLGMRTQNFQSKTNTWLNTFWAGLFALEESTCTPRDNPEKRRNTYTGEKSKSPGELYTLAKFVEGGKLSRIAADLSRCRCNTKSAEGALIRP